MTLKPARLLVLLLAIAAIPVMAQNVAVVNGKPIPTSRLDAIVKQAIASGQQKDTPDLRARIKEQLIDTAILSQEAEKLGLTKNEDVKEQLELARTQILIRALVQDHIKKFVVKDEAVKAEYEKVKAQAPAKEYHARHILVEKEDDAKSIIAQLKKGAKFEDLAKQHSKDSTAANGGDLDWAVPQSFVKEFSDAMIALPKGQFTETPVHTKFGYHIIKLEDERAAKVPTLEEIKPQIIQRLQQQELESYHAALKAKAKITQ